MVHTAFEELAFWNGLGPLVIVLVVRLWQQTLLAASVLDCLPNTAFLRLCEVAMVLFDPQMPQLGGPKQILRDVAQKEIGIWICWELFDMPRCARRPGTAPWNEFARRPHDWARGPYDVKAEKPIVCHAEANSAALQEVVHSVTFST